MPTPDELRRLFRYDRESGKLYWLSREGSDAFNAKWAGKEAFTATRAGYKVGNINQRTFAAHRVIWALERGEWPRFDIDHIDGDRANNRIANLRDVPRITNLRNARKSSRNTVGHTGVYRRSDGKAWCASISVQNRAVHLGSFGTIEAAIDARRAAEERLGFTKTHGRRL